MQSDTNTRHPGVTRGLFSLFSASAIGIAIAGALTLAPAAASAQGADEERIDEIVVTTARRREESVFDVPLSISVISGAQLARTGAEDIIEVAKQSPNVALEVSRGTNSTLSAFIRGAGQQDPVAGYESGVGLYLDDVYFNRPHAAVLDLYNVERVEVLRGPQGTLYGRNTIGGAIKYVTKPLADEPEFRIRGSVGSYGQIDGLLTGSIPLSDTFRVGASVASFNRDGFGDNLTLGTEQYDKDVLGFRATAEWDASPDLFFRFSGDYTEDDSSPKFGHRLLPAAFSGLEILDDVFDTRGGLNVPEQEVESDGLSLLAQWQASDMWTFKAIIADRSDSTFSPIDFDSLPAADLDVPVNYENEQFSVELQGLFSGERFNGVIGAYYLDANAFNEFDVVLDQLGVIVGSPGFNANTFGDVDTETWSVFGDVTFDLSETVSLSVGGRYTSDERDAVVLRRTFVCPPAEPDCGGLSPTFGGTAILAAVTSDFQGSEEFTEFTPRVSVSWAPSEAHNLYASYANGFKGGGFDPRGQTTAAEDLDNDGTVTDEEIFEYMNFDSETVDSYEFGWKTTAIDGRLFSAISVFFMDYTDYQVPGSLGVDTDGDGLQDTFVGSTSNAGEATMNGIEAEGSFRATDNVNLNWAIGYIDAEFDEFVVAGDDLSDIAVVQNTPEWTAKLSANITLPVYWFGRDGNVFIIPSLAYRDDTSQFEVPSVLLDQESYSLWDLSLVWEDDDGKWRVGLHGKNLADEEYKVAGYDFPALGLEGNVTAFYGNPRTVTLRGEYRF